MRAYLVAAILITATGHLWASDSGLIYTGAAESWSIEAQGGGYHFKCFDGTNWHVNIHSTTATNSIRQLAEVARTGKIKHSAIKSYAVDTLTVYEFHKKEWPKDNYHIYFKLKNRVVVVRWFDMPSKPDSGKEIFPRLRSIKEEPNRALPLD